MPVLTRAPPLRVPQLDLHMLPTAPQTSLAAELASWEPDVSSQHRYYKLTPGGARRRPNPERSAVPAGVFVFGSNDHWPRLKGPMNI